MLVDFSHILVRFIFYNFITKLISLVRNICLRHISSLKEPICHSNECQIGSFSSEATIWQLFDFIHMMAVELLRVLYRCRTTVYGWQKNGNWNFVRLRTNLVKALSEQLTIVCIFLGVPKATVRPSYSEGFSWSVCRVIRHVQDLLQRTGRRWHFLRPSWETHKKFSRNR